MVKRKDHYPTFPFPNKSYGPNMHCARPTDFLRLKTDCQLIAHCKGQMNVLASCVNARALSRCITFGKGMTMLLLGRDFFGQRNDACFNRKFPNDPVAVVYRLCALLNSWAILQKNHVRRRLEEGAEKIQLVLREVYARSHGWSTNARIIL